MTRNLILATLLCITTFSPCHAAGHAGPSNIDINGEHLHLSEQDRHASANVVTHAPVNWNVAIEERPAETIDVRVALGESDAQPKSTHTWLDSDEEEIYNYDIDIRIVDFPSAPDRSWLYYFSLQVNFTDHEEWSHGGFQWSGTKEFEKNNNKGVNWGGGSNWAGYGGIGVTNTPYTWETGKWYRYRVWRLDKDEAGRWRWLFAVLDYETGKERQLGTVITKSDWIDNAVVWIETGYGVKCDTHRAYVEWRNPVFRTTASGESRPSRATTDYNGTCNGVNNTNQGLVSREPLQWFQSTNMPRSIAPGVRLWAREDHNAAMVTNDPQDQAAAPVAAAAPAATVAVSAPAAVTPSTTTDFANELLGEHNRIRNEVGVGPLTWSDSIAAYAQEWANRLASNGCTLVHRTEGRYGENLAAWTGRRSPGDAARMWEEERPLYDGGVMNDKNFAAGHYTQIVWRNTQNVGCAQASCGTTTVSVCNYDPPGNYFGEKAY